MGAYERKTFRWFWGAWCWALLGGILIFGSLTYLRAMLVLFAVVELWGAFRQSYDDTLSEFAMWARGVLAPKPAGRWLVVAIIFACAWTVGYTASFGISPASAIQGVQWHGVLLLTFGPNPPVGVIAGVLVAGILTWHLLLASDYWQ